MNSLREGNSLLHYRTSNYIAKSILFWLSTKKTVNDATVNIKKAKKKEIKFLFLSSKCFPCRGKHSTCGTECTIGECPGPKTCSRMIRLKGTMQPSCSSEAVILTYQFHLSRRHSRCLKKDQAYMINTHQMKRHEPLPDTTTGNVCAV